MRAGSKELRQALARRGLTVAAGAKHLYVLDEQGHVLRGGDGRPVMISKGARLNTTSIRRLLARLDRL